MHGLKTIAKLNNQHIAHTEAYHKQQEESRKAAGKTAAQGGRVQPIGKATSSN